MSNPVLDNDRVSEFHAKGFAVLPRLIDDDCLEELREVYDQLLSGTLDTTGSRDSYLGDVTRQLVGPENCHPLFRANATLSAGCCQSNWGYPPVQFYKLHRTGSISKAFSKNINIMPREGHEKC
ncbi:MAG: hypothetical protein AAF512_22700 [Pseudomonadota bacterium]